MLRINMIIGFIRLLAVLLCVSLLPNVSGGWTYVVVFVSALLLSVDYDSGAGI